jgi:LysR family nitrogen assimilation transcriptional regulator
VTLKFSDAESDALQSRIESQTLDMALVFEDEFVPNFARQPLFRQRLYLVRREPLADCQGVVSLEQVAKLPLVLPPLPRHRRIVIDRAFAAVGLTPNIIAETDAALSELSAVRSGVGSSIFNAGTFKNVYPGAFAEPLLIEPPIFLTCSLVSSSDSPLTHAGEAVKNVLIGFVKDQITANTRPGAELIA